MSRQRLLHRLGTCYRQDAAALAIVAERTRDRRLADRPYCSGTGQLVHTSGPRVGSPGVDFCELLVTNTRSKPSSVLRAVAEVGVEATFSMSRWSRLRISTMTPMT